jgi:hypothetical protein
VHVEVWEVGWTTAPDWTAWRRENSWSYRNSNSDLSVVQPVASRYTDWAIPAPVTWRILKGSDDGVHLGLLGFWIMSFAQYSKEHNVSEAGSVSIFRWWVVATYSNWRRRAGVSHTSPEYGNRSSFRNVLFFCVFRITGDGENPKPSKPKNKTGKISVRIVSVHAKIRTYDLYNMSFTNGTPGSVPCHLKFVPAFRPALYHLQDYNQHVHRNVRTISTHVASKSQKHKSYCDAYPLLGNGPVDNFPLKRVTTTGRPLLGNVSVNTSGQQ